MRGARIVSTYGYGVSHRMRLAASAFFSHIFRQPALFLDLLEAESRGDDRLFYQRM